MTIPRGRILRHPQEDVLETTVIGHYCRWLNRQYGLSITTYDQLWKWSVSDLDQFWRSVIDFFHVDVGSPQSILENDTLPGGPWLEGASLSYPEHILRGAETGEALVGISQVRDRQAISWEDLREEVARCVAGLKRLGVGTGDCIAGYLPNIPESVVAFLATASIGAIWVSCPPEFGSKAVIDRFSQVQPKILFAVAGYGHGDKVIDRRDQVKVIRESIVSIDHVVDVPYLPADNLDDALPWQYLLEEYWPLTFEKLPFDHPLYVLFSSGTTGLPKPIIHGHGGILLEHFKAQGLHNDLQSGDRFFWFSTTGWMLWNYGVSALLTGATMICFDGNPMWPDTMCLWQMAEREKVTFFGNSATYYMTCRNQGLSPTKELDFSNLRVIGSTGSPLPVDGFEWLAKQFGPEVIISSVSGGTDICSGFMGASPLVTIRAGELAAPALGCAIAALDENGREVIGEPGELVVKTPMPSMPVGFWGDDGTRYLDSYYSQNPGLWTHGDWVIIFEDGASIVTGRSDATLNRGGVRLGTADFYSVIENIEGISDSLIVHLEGNTGDMGNLILFVVAKGDVQGHLDAMSNEIRKRLKNDLSPRHVPDEIVWLSGIPRTLTGKKIEAPIKKLLKGSSLNEVVSTESLVNAAALNEIANWHRQFKA